MENEETESELAFWKKRMGTRGRLFVSPEEHKQIFELVNKITNKDDSYEDFMKTRQRWMLLDGCQIILKKEEEATHERQTHNS